MSTLPTPTSIALTPQLTAAVGGVTFDYGFVTVTYATGAVATMPLKGVIDSAGTIIDPATAEGQTSALAELQTIAGDQTAGNTLLTQIVALLQQTAAETLWTDNTGAYFIRVDNPTGGAPTWKTINGVASAAPGAGAKPAADRTAPVTDKTAYQAIAAAGTTIAAGDFIDHFVTTDSVTGAIVGQFWLNSTQGAVLAAAPATSNLTALSLLPQGAATLAEQQAIAGVLQQILTALGSSADAAVATATGSATQQSVLKGILKALLGTLSVEATALPLPAGAAADGADIPGATMPAGGSGIRGWLSTISSNGATAAGQASALTELQAIASATAAGPTAANQGAANTLLTQMVALLQQTAAETLWTDNTGAYFIRVDNPTGGAPTWKTINGVASAAPGAGAKPAADRTAPVTDKTAYQAIAAAGTTIAAGDFIDHFVTTDSVTGAIVGQFWLNSTQGAVLAAAPATSNLAALSLLPQGAATLAEQQAIASVLQEILTALGTTLSVKDASVVAALGSPAQDATVAKLINPGSAGAGDFSGSPPSAASVQAMALLQTIPANPGRLCVEVQNQSTSVLTVVRDDGTSNTGLGNNATVWLLNSYDGATTGMGGGSWSSRTFKGRVRIYGAAGTQFAAYQD